MQNTDTISITTSAPPTPSTHATPATPAKRGPLRRRFTFAAVGTLAVLMAVLGVNFAGDSGTASPAITGSAGIVVTTPETPQGWAVSVGSAGSVPAPGATNSIASINPAGASSSKMLVSVYVTNLSDLAVNYSSWNFNLQLFDSSATPAQIGDTLVATSDSGVVSWVVTIDPAKTYKVKLAEGGSFYTIANGASGSLSPEFFVRATQL